MFPGAKMNTKDRWGAFYRKGEKRKGQQFVVGGTRISRIPEPGDAG